MARTTADEVNEIMDISLSDAIVNAYIDVANSIVTGQLGGSNLTEAQLTEIERWLTAHLIASTRARMGATEKLGEASISYIGLFGMGLKSTPYGQTVEMLDSTGTLSIMGKKRISIKAITSFE